MELRLILFATYDRFESYRGRVVIVEEGEPEVELVANIVWGEPGQRITLTAGNDREETFEPIRGTLSQWFDRYLVRRGGRIVITESVGAERRSIIKDLREQALGQAYGIL